jgi:hypothetical protein
MGMTLSYRVNNFTQPDYSIVWRADGREFIVGRIFKANADVPRETRWVWSVEFHQRAGRTEPHQGHCATEDEAKAAWKRCWQSADVPVKWPPPLRDLQNSE